MAPSARKQSEVKNPIVFNPHRIEFKESPSYISFYSNNVQFSINTLDFSLSFGEVLDVTTDLAIVERRARVTMHPAQAKVLMIMLMQNIQAYEKINGEIQIPAGSIGIPNSENK